MQNSRLGKTLGFFRILYAGFAGLNEFSRVLALLYGPKMFAMNIYLYT